MVKRKRRKKIFIGQIIEIVIDNEKEKKMKSNFDFCPSSQSKFLSTAK